MANQEKTNKPFYVVVDGEQVFTAKYVFEQMQAQSSRIDRARNIALASILINLISIAVVLIKLLAR